MSIDPPGKGPKVPGQGAPGVERPDRPADIQRPEQAGRDFAARLDAPTATPPTAAAEAPAGIDQVRAIARALRSGEITSRDDALTRAAETMLEAGLPGVPPADLARASAEISRLAREDPVLRERVGHLLDRLGQDDDR